MKIIIFDIKSSWKSDGDKILRKYDYNFKSDIEFVSCNLKLLRTYFNVEDYPKAGYVSPANSYGWMDGGIDLFYRKMFKNVEKDVKETICKYSPYTDTAKIMKKSHVLPVGSSLIVTIENSNDILISAPTMFLPEDVRGSNNSYYATLASLRVIEKYGNIDILFLPGMCTGCGCLSNITSIKQILNAIKTYETKDNIMEDESPHKFIYLPKDLHNNPEIQMHEIIKNVL